MRSCSINFTEPDSNMFFWHFFPIKCLTTEPDNYTVPIIPIKLQNVT